MVFDEQNGFSDAEIIRLVREGSTTGSREAQKDVGVAIMCAQVLISHAVQAGATHQETICQDFSVKGVPHGDWKLTAEKITGGPDGPDWLAMASRFELGASRFRTELVTNTIIERCTQRDGSFLWAIRDHGLVLNKDGEWEYEPQPSSRDDDFLERCRYATKEEALKCFQEFGVCDYPVKVG